MVKSKSNDGINDTATTLLAMTAHSTLQGQQHKLRMDDLEALI
jgi:hypothetical protein